MPSTREILLREIEVFCRITGTSTHRFGIDAVGSGRLVARLRNGQGVNIDTLDNLRAYMVENRPRWRQKLRYLLGRVKTSNGG